jgi:hypothetical protein
MSWSRSSSAWSAWYFLASSSVSCCRALLLLLLLLLRAPAGPGPCWEELYCAGQPSCDLLRLRLGPWGEQRLLVALSQFLARAVEAARVGGGARLLRHRNSPRDRHTQRRKLPRGARACATLA